MPAFSTLTSDGQQNISASYVTAPVSPVAGSALLLPVVTFENSSTQPSITSVAGCGLTWTQVGQADHDTAGGDRGTTFLWKGVGTPTTGAITINFAASVNRASWVVIQVTDADTTAPVVQFSNAVVNAASASANLIAFADPDNAAFACFGVQISGSANVFTPEAGYTAGGAFSGASFYHCYTEHRTGQDTTPSGSWTGTARAGIVAAEIAAASAVAVTGNLAATLPALAVAAAGNLLVDGTLAGTLPGAVASATADVTVAGDVAAGLPELTVAIEAEASVAGVVLVSLPALVVALDGTVTAGMVVGTIGAGLPLLAVDLAAVATLTGTVVAALAAPEVTAAAVVQADGVLDATLPALLVELSGVPLVEPRDLTLTIGPPGFDWATVLDPFLWAGALAPYEWVAIADPFAWEAAALDAFGWDAVASSFVWVASAPEQFVWAAGPPFFD